MRTLGRILLFALLTAVILGGIGLWGMSRFVKQWTPDPTTIASASLEGLRAQNRLSALVATYVAVTTSTQSRFGLSAQRTLIMPGRVRYEVDLGKLRQRDVVWNGGALDVTLPPVEIDGPDVDPARIRAYDSGGLLLSLTHTGDVLDAANRKAAVAELLRQAREPVPMQLARDATRRAVEQSFALPLRAAGMDAKVRVRFAGEPGFPPEPSSAPMQRSRSIRQVLGLDP